MVKNAYILIGVPASGKSTWRFGKSLTHDIISTDDIIEEIAMDYGFTYNEAFNSLIKFAEKVMWSEFDYSIAADNDIIIDRTNLTKARSRFIEPLKKAGYKVTAVVFPIPEKDEWERRLNSRTGKSIPKDVIENMVKSFQFPELYEGFDEIILEE